MPVSNDEIKHRMGYHRATFPESYDPAGSVPLADYVGYRDANRQLASAPLHAHLRKLYIELAKEVRDITSESREQSLALTALQESLMWANADVAMHAPLIEE